MTRGLFDEFGGERVRDCPLNEAAIVGFGIGLAMAGRPTICELEFMDFLTFAMDPRDEPSAQAALFLGRASFGAAGGANADCGDAGIRNAALAKSGGVVDACAGAARGDAVERRTTPRD